MPDSEIRELWKRIQVLDDARRVNKGMKIALSALEHYSQQENSGVAATAIREIYEVLLPERVS